MSYSEEQSRRAALLQRVYDPRPWSGGEYCAWLAEAATLVPKTPLEEPAPYEVACEIRLQRLEDRLSPVRDVYYDRWLESISIEYNNPDYIVPQTEQFVPMDEPTGLIARYVKSDWFRAGRPRHRAPGTLSRRGGFTIDHSVYAMARDSYGFELPNEVRDAMMDAGNLHSNGTPLAGVEKALLACEMDCATNLFTAGVWTDLSGYRQWTDYGVSVPLIVAYYDAPECSLIYQYHKNVHKTYAAPYQSVRNWFPYASITSSESPTFRPFLTKSPSVFSHVAQQVACKVYRV